MTFNFHSNLNNLYGYILDCRRFWWDCVGNSVNHANKVAKLVAIIKSIFTYTIDIQLNKSKLSLNSFDNLLS